MNPYLLLAVILGAALTGIEDAAEPPEPVTGNAYEMDAAADAERLGERDRRRSRPAS